MRGSRQAATCSPVANHQKDDYLRSLISPKHLFLYYGSFEWSRGIFSEKNVCSPQNYGTNRHMIGFTLLHSVKIGVSGRLKCPESDCRHWTTSAVGLSLSKKNNKGEELPLFFWAVLFLLKNQSN